MTLRGIQPGIHHCVQNYAASSSSGELSAALGEAVRRGDVERMRKLLKDGADPEAVEPGNTGVSAQADELLQAARKINRLLPRGTQTGARSDFEEALQNYDLPRARKLLDAVLARIPPDLNATEAAIALWQAAARQGVDAILDTMLVLGGDKLARYRSGTGGEDNKTLMDALLTPNGLNRALHYPLQAAGMRHGALRDYLKQFPYYAAKPVRQDVAKLNGEADFKDNPEQKIVCRHLALAWLTRVRDKGGKPDYGILGDKVQIQENIPYRIEAEYEVFRANAAEVHMVANGSWGRFAADQFKAIEAGMEQGGTPVKRMLVESGNHSMAVEFKIKEKDGRKSYVQNFYDPNLTNVHKRLRFDGEYRQEAHSLDQLLHSLSDYQDYYGDSETVSMVYAVPDDGNTAASATGNPGRLLSSSLDDIDIDASVLFNLLDGGFADDLDKIADRLLDNIRKQPDQAIDLLAAKDAANTPGLHRALEEGDAKAVKIFAGIVQQSGLDTEQQFELLAARRSNGSPGLFIALQRNNADAVRAFVESIGRSSLGDEQQFELLAARRSNGTTGLSMALQKNNADAVRAFMDGVLQSSLGDDQKTELLAARRSDGTPGLFSALQKDNADAVRAFVESIGRSQLSDEQKVELLAAKEKGGMPGILMAESKSIPNGATAAYRDALRKWLTPEQQALLEAELVSNKWRRTTHA